MAMRMSFGPTATPRRHPFGSSMGGATPGNATTSVPPLSHPTFELPHHILLDVAGNNPPRLDFSSLRQRIAGFSAKLDRYIGQSCTDIDSAHKEGQQELREKRAERDKLQEDIREAKENELALIKTVDAEKNADDDLRAVVAQLKSKLEVYNDRVATARQEIEDLKRRITSKEGERAEKRQKLMEMKDRNEPERAALEALLGCQARHTRGKDQISFVFSLIDANDYDTKAWFTLDLSTRQYVLADHSPHLPDAVIQPLLADLNRTRNPWSFTKAIRKAWMDQCELRRMEG